MQIMPDVTGPSSDLSQVWPPLTDLEAMFKDGVVWPPRQESNRLKTYKENIALRENRFNDCWQDYNRLLREDSKKELSMYLGYFWLVTKKSLDLLIGRPPIISLATEDTDTDSLSLNDYLGFTDFNQVLSEVASDMDSLGTGIFKLYKDSDGICKIQSNSPDTWFPVVRPGAIREYRYHVLADVFHRVEYDNWGEPKSKSYYLKVEIHSEDEIENRIYGLDNAIRTAMTYTGMAATGMSFTVQKQLPLINFEDLFGPMVDVEKNPLGDGEFLVVPVPSHRGSKEVYGRSSYGEDLKSVIRALINRYIMREQVLNKHSDPNMIGPKGMFDTYDPVTQKPIIRLGGQYLQYRWDPGMVPPDVHYLEFQQLASYMNAVQQDIDALKREFMDLAEIPPAVLAGSEDRIGARVSGIAYRLMLQPMVDKVNRISAGLKPKMLEALQIAGKLGAGNFESLTIQFSDPFPKIPIEEAQRVSSLYVARLLSRNASLRELGYTDDQIDQITQEILDEESQSMGIPPLGSPPTIPVGA